jgi:type IX secretion system PorP/SprF family membrane protein
MIIRFNKMKKSTLFTLVAILFATSVFAQQVPMYSHYYFNRFLYNPALAGSQDYGQAYLIYRNQWNKVADAPTTKAFTLDGPLKSEMVGLGVSLFQDNAGIFNSTGGQIAYRYGLKLAAEHRLDLGISLGFLDNRIDFNRLFIKHPNDPVLLNQYKNGTGFDATFGFNYTYDKLSIGFSVPQILSNKIVYDQITNISTIDDEVQYGLVRHYIGTIRYDFDLTDKLSFEPIAMVRAIPGAPVQYDVNAMFNYDDKFWLGGMYRSQYAATVSAATRINKQFVVGYSYDMAVNAYKQYLRGAHEVMLGYQFGGSPADDPQIKKRFEDVDAKIKKNTDDIKDANDKIKENKEDIDQNTEDIEDGDEELKKEIEKLKTDFETFRKAYEDGKKGTGLNAGDVFGFNNVYFDTDKFDIKGVSVAELNSLANIMKQNPDIKIGIFGHADVRGTDNYNEKLAQRRAQAVKTYLLQKGISADRLEVESLGEKQPASNQLSKNRRVEFRIISN